MKQSKKLVTKLLREKKKKKKKKKIPLAPTYSSISEILCGVSMDRGNESLIEKFVSHDQDGRHALLW